jgi:hypothetical protein
VVRSAVLDAVHRLGFAPVRFSHKLRVVSTYFRWKTFGGRYRAALFEPYDEEVPIPLRVACELSYVCRQVAAQLISDVFAQRVEEWYLVFWPCRSP